MAEDMGLLPEIGTWVLNEATRAIAALPGEPKVSINMSASQFGSGNVAQVVAEALKMSKLPPERLELEITESLLLADSTVVAFQIDTLREMGVKIAMDDFGTGFSSLGYLWRFGFDRIKIDRSFVHGLDSNPEKSREIIETVVLLGKRLGMEVTAEGVETIAHSDLLSHLGCDVLQVFYYGKPEPLEGGAGKQNLAGVKAG
jgi:EAL domain-containing protein (putative c-di-GMP-specific phosphodiesterase class I)